jgi:hypothetical protein
VDRLRAQDRGKDVSRLMEGISYDKASRGLTLYCLALMQNVPDDEQKRLSDSLALLDNLAIDPDIKVRLLGLQLMNVVGPGVLTAAVEALRKEMTENQKAEGRSEKPHQGPG